ncbi:MAG: hypothetical protein GY708_12310 [Actinomycetia bacterium]|nr:hypothetical protein [Actinomycetes bacterium]
MVNKQLFVIIQDMEGGFGEPTQPPELTDLVVAVSKALTVDFELLPVEMRRDCLDTMTWLRNSVEALDTRVVDAADDLAVFATSADGGSAKLRAWLYKRGN